MNLRTKATFFFGSLLLIIALGVVFYAQYVVGSTLKAQALDAIRIDAEQAEGSYFTFLKVLKRETLDWAASPMLQKIAEGLVSSREGTRERNSAMSEFASYIKSEKMPFDKMILMADILDKDGKVIASTRSARIGTDEAEEEVKLKAHYFSKTIVSKVGDVFVKSIIFEVDETPEPMIHATVRMFRSNADGTTTPLDAVLLVHFLSINDIAKVLSGEAQVDEGALTGKALLSTYQTSEIYVVNSNGYMVTPSRYVSNVEQQQKVDTLPVRECLQKGKEINQEYDDYRGVRVIGASMCEVSDGIVIIVEINKDEVFAPVIGLVNTTISVVLALFILGFFAIQFFIGLPIRNLNEILSALEQVMRGNFSVEAKVHTKDETGYLATMFNKMVAAIRENHEALENSKRRLEENQMVLTKELEEHAVQEKFLDESKRATQNLLEDSWRAKEALDVERHRLQTILSSIADGLVLIDGSYNITLINPTAVAMFGMSREELLGKDLRTIVTLWKKKKEIVPVTDWPIEQVFLTKRVISASLADDLSISTERHLEKVPIMFSAAPLRGGSVGAVIVFRDATNDRMLDEAKSGFISVASHQLRTPLTSIRWYSEMLLSEDAGSLNDTQKDFMKEVHGGAERLYQTVDLLLGLSRVESGKLKTDRSSVDLTTFTADIQKELSSQTDEKDIILQVSPPDRESVIVWLDPLMLRQVILNLLSNAIRYTNEHGRVEVTWSVRNDQKEEVVYSVRDDGIGIPKDAQPQVFSKFFRAENARSQVPDGSGLGLALVKELVESWGGKVWFETAEGHGTTFFFTVPLSTQVADIPVPARIEETK